MRGKGMRYDTGRNQSRITPAYAGKSPVILKSSHRIQDHPRLCGEKTYTLPAGKDGTGSPPPMRGKVAHSTRSSAVYGITPAYAGKSTAGSVSKKKKRDHPRLCGEKTKKIPKQRYFFHQPASFSFSLQYT